MNRVKKNKKKGFTLVELMIVVVIMIILAAAATPIFKGYLDRAKQARYLAECRAIYVAGQTVAQDFVIADQTIPAASIVIDDEGDVYNQSGNGGADHDASWDADDFEANVKELSGITPTGDETYTITIVNTAGTTEGNITRIVYTDGNFTVTFNPNENVNMVAN